MTMLVADSSAWIEWLRATGSPAHLAFREAFRGEQVLVPEPVRAELMFGARTRNEADTLRRLFESTDLALIAPRDDFDAAIDLHQRSRSAGITARGLVDCLVLAMAARLGVPVLHHDRDFLHLAPLAGVAQAPGSLQAL